MAAANPFRFSTKYQDDETDLLYYGYRYYDPSKGRWVSRDPTEEQGGIVLYAYVANDPLSAVDTRGENTFTTILSIIPFIGTLYNWVTNPKGSSVSDYTIDLSQCDLDIEQGEAFCKAKIALQAAAYSGQNNALNLAHELVDAFGAALIKAPAAILVAAIDAVLDLGAWAKGYAHINSAANAAKAKCKCPCKQSP